MPEGGPQQEQPRRRGFSNLGSRTVVVFILTAIGLLATWLGGWVFFTLVAVLTGVAAWEFWHMYVSAGIQPSLLPILGGSLAFLFSRQLLGFCGDGVLLAALVILAMLLGVVNFPRHGASSAHIFTASVAGALYPGWMAAFLVSLRALPDGACWLLLSALAASLFDVGAYLAGSLWGKHPIAPQISPHKSWEGVIGGFAAAVLGGLGLASLFHGWAPSVRPWHGLALGVAIGLLSPFADLAESMLKRSFHLKDTGKLLPGHGGALDRMDSWLWAAPAGYYLITLLFLR